MTYYQNVIINIFSNKNINLFFLVKNNLNSKVIKSIKKINVTSKLCEILVQILF